jgi:hypothetical protein
MEGLAAPEAQQLDFLAEGDFQGLAPGSRAETTPPLMRACRRRQGLTAC